MDRRRPRSTRKAAKALSKDNQTEQLRIVLRWMIGNHKGVRVVVPADTATHN